VHTQLVESVATLANWLTLDVMIPLFGIFAMVMLPVAL
jgi:hypothetical protein